ncbi:MAG: ABC transporter permease [Chloroflexi bacterium]|nr:ABC transporter permease [Chloroflexota bacterium]
MLFYVTRRLLWLPFLLLTVTFVTFGLGLYGPGDPVQTRLGTRYTPEAGARIRHQMGLDRPFMVQYGDYIWKALHGNLGESYRYPGQAVARLMGKKMWVSAQLGLAATLVGVIGGIPLGLLAAGRQGTWLDTAIVGFSLFFVATPVFITAPFLILVFAIKLHILPTSGWQGLLDPHIVMPALVMGLPGIAGLARFTRASTLEVLGQDFVRTARAKGLPELVVQTRHILRNALIPVMTILGLSLATLVEGAFITETMFGIPGMGRLALDSIFQRDYPVVMGLTLIIAIGFVMANLLVDLLYAFLDPRIRYR